MKITDPNGRAVSRNILDPNPPVTGKLASDFPGASTKPDQVLLSGLGALASAASNESGWNLAKISSLQSTISSGMYQIEAGVLSNRIIEDSLIAGQAYI